jgi:hypothetical protein
MTALRRERLDDRIEVLRAREMAPHPPEGMRRLKALFRELTGAAASVEHENAALIEWQRTGDGLPRGGLRSG